MRAFFLVSALFLAASAHAAPADRGGPVLRLQKTTGFVPRELSGSMKCEIFYNRIELTKTFAGVEVKETRAIAIDTSALYALIDRADQAKLETTRGPVDGPSYLYEGLQILPTDLLKSVVLEQLNGGTGVHVTNPSGEARILKRILGELCGESN